MKKTNNKGFTLMEMLIVVAIIAILIAIAIPTFTSQLEKAREAADAANIRSAYAEAMIKYLDDGATSVKSNAMTQTKAGWVMDVSNVAGYDISSVSVVKGDTVTVTIDAEGTASFAKSGS